MGAAPAGASVGPQRTLRAPSVLPADFYPGKGFRAGRTIPKGYAVVTRRARLDDREREGTRLKCPAGYRMRSLATTSPRLGFLVVRADRRYYLRLRTVRMSLFSQRPAPYPQRPAATTAAARPVRGTMAGLCRRARR